MALARWPADSLLNLLAATARALEGDESGARGYLDKASTADPNFGAALIIRADLAVRSGNCEAALDQYRSARPELVGEAAPRVDGQNYVSALGAALVLRKTGDARRAAELLDGAERAIQTLNRLDSAGYGIADVQIMALRGRRTEALEAQRRAVNEGWRGPFWRYHRDLDPALDSIRNEPELEAAFAAIERDIERQRLEISGQAAL